MRQIALTADEVHLASSHGLLRRHQKLSGHRGDRAQKGRSTWDNEIEGACAELAFCKLRGIYWTGAEGLRAKDGGALDIRWTKHEGKGGLIVYRHDDDNVVMVLMDGFSPNYRIVGWLRCGDAKQDRWMQKEGYYLVPRGELKPA